MDRELTRHQKKGIHNPPTARETKRKVDTTLKDRQTDRHTADASEVAYKEEQRLTRAVGPPPWKDLLLLTGRAGRNRF